jgi:hypothetical protein
MMEHFGIWVNDLILSRNSEQLGVLLGGYKEH